MMHKAVDMVLPDDNRIRIRGRLVTGEEISYPVPDREAGTMRYWLPNDDETDEYIDLIENEDLVDDEEPVYVSEDIHDEYGCG